MKNTLLAIVLFLVLPTFTCCAAFAGPSPLDLGDLVVEGSHFVVNLPLNTPWCRTATGGDGMYDWKVVFGPVRLDADKGPRRCIRPFSHGKFQVDVSSNRRSLKQVVSLYGTTTP